MVPVNDALCPDWSTNQLRVTFIVNPAEAGPLPDGSRAIGGRAAQLGPDDGADADDGGAEADNRGDRVDDDDDDAGSSDADGIVWSLRLATREDFNSIAARVDAAAFEAANGVRWSEEAVRESFAGFEGWAPPAAGGNSREDDAALWADAMEVDEDEEGETAGERPWGGRTSANAPPPPRPGSARDATLGAARIRRGGGGAGGSGDGNDDNGVAAVDAAAADFALLALGAGDTSFAVREGGGVEAFRNTPGGLTAAHGVEGGGAGALGAAGGGTPLRGGALASPLPGRGGDATTPVRVLLAGGERRMLLLTPPGAAGGVVATPGDARTPAHAPDGLGRELLDLDLERGSVVRRFRFAKDGAEVPVADVCQEDKAAGLDDRPTFLAVDSNRVARFDRRVGERGGAAVVDAGGGGGRRTTRSGVARAAAARSDTATDDAAAGRAPGADLTYIGGKDYSRGTNFTCLATAGRGEVVAGARDGRVRLYASVEKLSRAVTTLPSCGAPVTHVDVTWDARWVLATTDRHLLLVKTSFRTDVAGTSRTTGFHRSMNSAGNQCAAPRLLRLTGEDRARVGPAARFVAARFSWVTERRGRERWIVARVGGYTAMWSMRAVADAAAATERAEDAAAESRVLMGGGRAAIGDRPGDRDAALGFRVAGADSYVLRRVGEEAPGVGGSGVGAGGADPLVDASLVHDRWRHRNGDDAAVVLTRHQLYAGADDESSDGL